MSCSLHRVFVVPVFTKSYFDRSFDPDTGLHFLSSPLGGFRLPTPEAKREYLHFSRECESLSVDERIASFASFLSCGSQDFRRETRYKTSCLTQVLVNAIVSEVTRDLPSWGPKQLTHFSKLLSNLMAASPGYVPPYQLLRSWAEVSLTKALSPTQLLSTLKFFERAMFYHEDFILHVGESYLQELYSNPKIDEANVCLLLHCFADFQFNQPKIVEPLFDIVLKYSKKYQNHRKSNSEELRQLAKGFIAHGVAGLIYYDELLARKAFFRAEVVIPKLKTARTASPHFLTQMTRNGFMLGLRRQFLDGDVIHKRFQSTHLTHISPGKLSKMSQVLECLFDPESLREEVNIGGFSWDAYATFGGKPVLLEYQGRRFHCFNGNPNRPRGSDFLKARGAHRAGFLVVEIPTHVVNLSNEAEETQLQIFALHQLKKSLDDLAPTPKLRKRLAGAIDQSRLVS